jgi:hypothetical protein
MSTSQGLEHRRYMNRLNAQRSRERKRKYVAELEARVAELAAENKALKEMLTEEQSWDNQLEYLFPEICI